MTNTKKSLTPYMTKKLKKRQREYAREYYARNKDKILSKRRKRLETTELIIPDTTKPITTERYDTSALITVQSVAVSREYVEIVTDDLTFVVDKSMRLTICHH